MSVSADNIQNLITKATKSAKSEKELSGKGLTFGKWWFEVRDYEKAAEWITRYLRVFDKDAKAHKLLGDVYEKLGRSDAALACFKNSLRVKPQQYELMLKVAEIHINPGPTQNPSRAQVWLDKAAIALPNNPLVYKLKMELYLALQAPPDKLKKAILEELSKRPNDASLYVQYVTFLKDQELLEEAFEYSHNVYNDSTIPLPVENDLDWSQCLIDTCQEYADRMSGDDLNAESIKAYTLLLTSLCRHIHLCMEQEKFDDALEKLVILDSSLHTVMSSKQQSDTSEWSIILQESKGQLYWFAGTLLIHQATRDKLSWNLACKQAFVCYSASLTVPIPDTTATWASWRKDDHRSSRLRSMGGMRMSQSAHMISNLLATSRSSNPEENEICEQQWMQEITDTYCTSEGGRKIFTQLFDQNSSPDGSTLYRDDCFRKLTLKPVTDEELYEYDNVAVVDLDLQSWVWIGLQNKKNNRNSLDLFPWVAAVFPNLPLSSTASMKFGNVNSLCRLDMEAFIVACVIHAGKLASLYHGTRANSGDDALDQASLPLHLCKKLVTGLQTNWWDAVCKLHTSHSRQRISNINQIKATVRHGTDCIRGTGNHGLEVMLIVGLAKHFASKAYSIGKSGLGKSSAPWQAYQQRAARYWTLAVPMLQDIVRNKTKTQLEPKDRLFSKCLDDPMPLEARMMMSEVYMCNGELLVSKGDLDGALQTYGKAETPHASFCEALIYKQLLNNSDREDVITDSGNKRKEALQSKYYGRLEVTLNRLQRNPNEELQREAESLLREKNRSVVEEHSLTNTVPKEIPFQGNFTVNSEIDESILAQIPSKQSTPKDDMVNGRTTMIQLNENISALTSAVSAFQGQFVSQMNKNETPQKAEPAKENEKDSSVIQTICDKLDALTDVLSGLQMREEKYNEQLKQVQQTQAVQQSMLYHEQLLRSQLPSTPLGATRFATPQGRINPAPLQTLDQYQQAALAQGNMMPGSPYYGVMPYQSYVVPNAATPGAPGFPAMPAYVTHSRATQAVVQPSGMASPVSMQPPMTRNQQLSGNVGLPMSKEAADALSVRFQSSLSGSSSPIPNMQNLSAKNAFPSSGLGFQQEQFPRPATPTQSFPSQPMPEDYSASDWVFGQQQYLNPGEAITGLIQNPTGKNFLQSMGPNGVPGAPPPTFEFKLTTNTEVQNRENDFDESYLPPALTNVAKSAPQQDKSTLLRSLLMTDGKNKDNQAENDVKQVEINYPEHIHFPKASQTITSNSGWNFKFQTPEEIDRDNKKLEADEEAEDAETSHNDTGPYFEPIVSLPEVINVTGEENEKATFNERAKLYRLVDGEWKERGIGNMKILQHNDTGKHRLLMRREQVLKICCNHIISKDMELTAMQNSDRAWVWYAVDFAEETEKEETFAIRFKTPDIANQFKEKFNEGKVSSFKLTRRAAPEQPSIAPAQTESKTPEKSPIVANKPDVSTDQKFSFPKFSFPKPTETTIDLSSKIKGTTSLQDKTPEKAEEENRSACELDESDGPHFEPIVKLPEKIEQKTGEEEEEALFCHRAKLYRYVDNQWKDRGVGDIKILHNKSTSKCRIVMRREQVLKICSNHYITPDMELSPHGASGTSWTWTALDHSDMESEPRQELLTVRFKLADVASDFKTKFYLAKEYCSGKDLEQSTGVSTGISLKIQPSQKSDFSAIKFTSSESTMKSVQFSEVDSTTSGRLVANRETGQWNCSACYALNNVASTYCVLCGIANLSAPVSNVSTQPSVSKSGVQFNFFKPTTTFSFGGTITTSSSSSIFGIPKTTAESSTSSAVPFSFSNTGQLVMNKQSGSWNCSDCLATNPFTASNCLCCGQKNPNISSGSSDSQGSLQPGSSTKSSAKFLFGLSSETTSQSVTPVTTSSSIFGIPKTTTDSLISSSAPFSFSNTGQLVMKKQSGSWDCSDCLATNPSTASNCLCCGHKNPNVVVSSNDPQSSSKPGIIDSNAKSSPKFSFGLSSKTTYESVVPVHTSSKTVSSTSIPPPKFSFGISSGSHFAFSNNNNNTEVRASEPAGPFSSILQSLSKDANAVKAVTTQKLSARSPSPEYEYEESEDSEDSSDSSDEEEYVLNQQFRSPLSRPEKNESEEDDVICLGEILPPIELQKKAEKLMLPKHFYNFEMDDDGSSNSEEEDRSTDNDVRESTKQAVSSAPASKSSIPLSTLGGSNLSTFADLAKNSPSSQGFSFASGPGWVGMTGDSKPLFSTYLSEGDKANTSAESTELYQSDDKDNLHFDPVIALPDKVDIKTGEEDEETIYSQRCKLYRWFKPTSEWKERGVGDIKMKKNTVTGRIRIIMRRDQVLKVCANHYLRPGMTLETMSSSDRAWSWSAMDFADNEEPKMETFTARFKTPEVAQEFKENFDLCLTMLLDSDPMTPCKASEIRTKELSAKAEKMKNELKFFKDKFSEPRKIDLNNTLTDEEAFSTSKPPAIGPLTPLVAQHNENLRKSVIEHNLFQQSAKETAQKVLQFDDQDEAIENVPKGSHLSEDRDPSFVSKQKSVQSISEQKQESAHGADNVDDPEEETDVHFEPIVQLPDHVSLITGEEGEQVLFAQRGKLYIFHSASKQWKERGLGDVKILQSMTTYKVRVLMRREQVFKVCLNHLISQDLKLTYKENSGDKVVLWTALDFADEEKSEGEIHQFALRFKNSDRAGIFKSVFEEGREAASSNVLIQPQPDAINTSLAATSPGPAHGKDIKSPGSPEKPVSEFSFAGMKTPIDFSKKNSSETTVNVMGFVFGKDTGSTSSTVPTSDKFTFNMSKLSFDFHNTSTPQANTSASEARTPADVFFTPQQNTPSTKAISKTLFGSKEVESFASSSTFDSNIFSTPNETFSKPRVPSSTSSEKNLFAGEASQQAISKPDLQTNLFGTGGGNSFKPSPLAMSSQTSGLPAAFSVQISGSVSKFQFKPVSTETSQIKVVSSPVNVPKGSLPESDQSNNKPVEKEDDDVIFVCEAIPTDDQRKRAKDLLLPLTFFLFENKSLPDDYDEEKEEKKEDRIFKFIEARDSNKLDMSTIRKDPEISRTPPPKPENTAESSSTVEKQKDDQWVFGGSTTLDFGSLTSLAAVQNAGFKKDPSFQFPGAGTVMFQSLTNQDGEQDDYSCDAQYKPVLDKLPPLVEMKTGEEDEEVLFKERCKLFRYDKEKKEWKERGVGDIKILYNKEHDLHRVVMRREQVLKVCMNHVINEHTEPEPHMGSEKTCTYFAMDYSESQEPTAEQFAIRFKNADICQNYSGTIDIVKHMKHGE